MALRCKFEELDGPTRDYLLDVRARRGRGTPGIFVPGSNPRPVWAVIVGPLVAVMMLFFSLGSNKDPWAVAMLQTAALLIGGWAVLYAFRRWFAGRSAKYAGYFAYFDPLNAYQVQGEQVTVTSLKRVRGVEANAGRVFFDLGDRGQAVVVLSSPVQAQLVEDYYDAMDRLERQEDGPWADAPVAELGAAAKTAAIEEELPRKTAGLDLDVEEVPESPSRANRAGLGLLPLLLIAVAAAATYGVLWAVNKPLGDEMAFDRAKSEGAPGLRAYLLDARNTRHREEAKQLLSKAYDAPVARLRAAPPGKNAELREGMVKLVDSLRTVEGTPAVSIAVQPKEGAPAPPAGATVQPTQLRQEVADGLARSIGPELIAFAEPAEGKPAHLMIRYQVTPDPNRFGQQNVQVEIEIRTDVDAEPVARGSLELATGGPAPVGLTEQLRQMICVELVGEFRPAPPPDFGGGDFD